MAAGVLFFVALVAASLAASGNLVRKKVKLKCINNGKVI